MFAINGISFSLVELIVWVIVAAICGGIGEAIAGYSPGGFFGSVAIGLVGAWLGTFLARSLGLPAILTFTFNNVTIELLWAILGAALFVFLLGMIRRPAWRARTTRRRRYS